MNSEDKMSEIEKDKNQSDFSVHSEPDKKPDRKEEPIEEEKPGKEEEPAEEKMFEILLFLPTFCRQTV